MLFDEAVPVIINSKKKNAVKDDQRRFSVDIDFSIAQKSEYA